MDLLSFIQTADPTKVRVGERQRVEDEPKLLDTTVGCVVPLLPISPARTKSELEASVDKLFDKGGSGNQAKHDVAHVQPRHQKKRKTMVVDSGEPSHPAKRLRDDHGTSGGPTIGDKLWSAVQHLLVGAVQNAKVKGEAMPTLLFVTSSISTTPEREGGDHTESLAGANLYTIGAPTFVLIMTSVTTTTPNVDHAVIAKEKLVGSSLFGTDSSSAGGSHPIPGGFFDGTGSDFLIGGIHTFIDPDSNLQKVYVPKWNVTNGSRLDDGGVCCEMMSLSIEVWMRTEYNIKEKRRLKSIINEPTELLKAREKEIESLKEQLLLKEAEAVEAIRLRAKASKLEVVEKSLRDEAHVLKERNTTLEKEKGELEVKVADLTASVKVKEQEVADLDAMVTSVKSQNDNLVDQDDKMKEVNDKFDKLYTDFFEMALHLEEKFYPHLLTTIFWHRWLLTHDMELAIAKYLNSTEYLSTLGAAIGKAVEKGMQDGLFARIIHGAEGRNLTDVAAYNPYAEVDYISTLQHLQSVNFSLITELRSNKDVRVEMIMNLFHLEDTLADRLGLTESQPHVDQLMVPIHHSPDQHVIGASALSLSLDPLSATVLPGMEGTSDVIPATVDTTMTLSVTFSSVGTVTPISVDDYEVTGADDHTTANDSATNGNVDPFSNVDDVDLNVLQ
ncbi:hypothetical protein Tco_0699148 [Tanacetum coccineum]